MMRRVYDWMMKMAASPKAPHALAAVSFAESSFFPIPPDIMLIPMVIAERAKAWFFASLATVTSVLGGIAGYLIGYLLYDAVGAPLLDFYGYLEKFQHFSGQYNAYGAWIVLFAGVTPFPYKVITIASGVAGLNFAVFVIASIVARALRFFIVAGLLYWFGPPIREFIEKRFGLVTTLFFVLLFGGFFAIKYVF